MAEPILITRADVLAGAARRLRQHFGPRLSELFALFDEKSDADELHLIAIVNSPVDLFVEVGFTAQLTGELYDAYGYFVTTHLVKPTGDLAELARSEGVLL